MFDTCISLLKDAIDLICKHKESKKEKNFEISMVLEEISDLLKNTADKLSNNEYPHFNCSLMERMSNHLKFHMTGLLPEEQLEELHNSLIIASQIEKQFAVREYPDTIPKIYEASATFKTFSLLLKV